MPRAVLLESLQRSEVEGRCYEYMYGAICPFVQPGQQAGNMYYEVRIK